jgi:hypothetical protein
VCFIGIAVWVLKIKERSKDEKDNVVVDITNAD